MIRGYTTFGGVKDLVDVKALKVGVGGDERTFEIVVHFTEYNSFHFTVEGVFGWVVAFGESFTESTELKRKREKKIVEMRNQAKPGDQR